ncbi:DUF429 domain-containing protein [Paenalkalicoccus suaedae]|uniref:DUF429 domain-containing protein n=1 Tax=Paenalkalicoccus suaedae TaxID=2592382 RepID=A0A859FJD0_9BACI|nr:DUF429 domain-containing protein [Paenalkalicoccus suaedae]QKS72896.1 DUF429 domain-containing protein [Paenalkalicoccus suaedae]
MKTLGIDGSRNGWISAIFDDGAFVSWVNTSELPRVEADFIWIDMPIGIPDARAYPRQTEGLARKLLPGRASSVFSVPCREVLDVETYAEANELHRELTGKGLSKQSWYLFNKMIEVDKAVREGMPLCEAHPEVVLAGLAGGSMKHSKKTLEGQRERMDVMTTYSERAKEHIELGTRQFMRKDVAVDDLMDAYCLGLAASLNDLPLKRVNAREEVDRYGTAMNMVYREGGLR